MISQTGGLVGVMTDAGRALSKSKGDGFAAVVWLENDGAPEEQTLAFERGVFIGTKGYAIATFDQKTLVHLSGKRGANRLAEACSTGGLVVMNQRPSAEVPAGCEVIDTVRLRATGALALWPQEGGWEVKTARGQQGDRLWTRW